MKHSTRLYCLPFAGGNIYAYRKLAAYFAPSIIFTPLELPGRGQRMREPLLTDLDAMLADLLQQLAPDDLVPYALYGHSMGALLGYLLAQTLQRRHFPLPKHLFVSGHQSPAIPMCTKPLHALPDGVFLEKLKAFGGIPDEIVRESEFLALFLPIFRADFQAFEAYRPATDMPQLTIPITVLFGTDDQFPYEDALHWQHLTTGPTTFHTFSGNHFFIFDHVKAIGKLLSQTLVSATPTF